jgi:hypothetical protein
MTLPNPALNVLLHTQNVIVLLDWLQESPLLSAGMENSSSRRASNGLGGDAAATALAASLANRKVKACASADTRRCGGAITTVLQIQQNGV